MIQIFWGLLLLILLKVSIIFCLISDGYYHLCFYNLVLYYHLCARLYKFKFDATLATWLLRNNHYVMIHNYGIIATRCNDVMIIYDVRFPTIGNFKTSVTHLIFKFTTMKLTHKVNIFSMDLMSCNTYKK